MVSFGQYLIFSGKLELQLSLTSLMSILWCHMYDTVKSQVYALTLPQCPKYINLTALQTLLQHH